MPMHVLAPVGGWGVGFAKVVARRVALWAFPHRLKAAHGAVDDFSDIARAL